MGPRLAELFLAARRYGTLVTGFPSIVSLDAVTIVVFLNILLLARAGLSFRSSNNGRQRLAVPDTWELMQTEFGFVPILLL